MADEPKSTGETETMMFRRRAAMSMPASKGAVLASGTGISTAAVVFPYQFFAQKGDLEALQKSNNEKFSQMRQVQSAQWDHISALRLELHNVKSHAQSYEKLLDFVTTGNIRAFILPTTGKTNQ